MPRSTRASKPSFCHAGDGPAAPAGVVRCAQPLHELGDAPGHEGEARVDALIDEGLRRGVCLEMLDLSPDAGARVGETRGLSGAVPVEGPEPAVVVLSRLDNAAKLEEARLVEALGEGHVAPDTLRLALGQE